MFEKSGIGIDDSELEGGNFAKALAPIDVAFNKLKASRGKDIETVGEMISQGVISREEMSDVYKSVKRDNPVIFDRVERGIEAVEINLRKQQEGHIERITAYLDQVKTKPLGESNLRGVLGIDFGRDFGRLDDAHREDLLAIEKDFISDKIDAKSLIKLTENMSKPTEQMKWNGVASELAEIASTSKVFQATRVNNLVHGAIQDKFIIVSQGMTVRKVIKKGILEGTTQKDALSKLKPLFKRDSKNQSNGKKR